MVWNRSRVVKSIRRSLIWKKPLLGLTVVPCAALPMERAPAWIGSPPAMRRLVFTIVSLQPWKRFTIDPKQVNLKKNERTGSANHHWRSPSKPKGHPILQTRCQVINKGAYQGWRSLLSFNSQLGTIHLLSNVPPHIHLLFQFSTFV